MILHEVVKHILICAYWDVNMKMLSNLNKKSTPRVVPQKNFFQFSSWHGSFIKLPSGSKI